MIINFKNVKIDNFLSIGHAELKLDTSGYTLINGINNNPDDSAKSNGAGKCFGKNTRVLMWDGTTKAVQDIVPNDIVMGWDSTPRLVLETHSGFGTMYKVTCNHNNYTYTCNKNHILCLRKTIHSHLPASAPDFLEISVEEWLKLPDIWKRNYCQYIMPVTDFYTNPLSSIKLDPYFLGLWLGDGYSTSPAVCSADLEIRNYLYSMLEKFPELHIKEVKKQNGTCITYRFSSSQHGTGRGKNIISDYLHYYGLIKNKHIPLEYMTASESIRLQVLAGLIDTDGCLVTKTKLNNENIHYYYEFVQSDTQLAMDTIDLARGLGFKVNTSIKNTVYNKNTGERRNYIRICIYGDLKKIPVLLQRKKVSTDFNYNNSICYSLHPKIEQIEDNNYYGFQISGDGKFLLADNLVVHNSSIFEALSWTLLGDTIRGCKDVTNLYGTDGALVEVDFSIDNHEYKVIRSKDHSKLKTNLKIYIDGEDKSGKGIRDSQKLLEEYLPEINSQLLGSVIILGQGLPQKFSDNSPSGRKEVLETLSKSDFMINDLKDRISKRKQKLQSDLRISEDKILQHKSKIDVYSNEQISNENKLKSFPSLEDLDNKINIIATNLSECNSKLDIVELTISTLSTSQLEESNKKSDLIKDANSKKEDINSKYDSDINNAKIKYTSINSTIKSKESELSKLRSVKDTCPTCHQKLPGVFKPDTSEIEKELVCLREDLNSIAIQGKDLTSKKQNLYNSIDLEFATKEKEINSKLSKINEDLYIARSNKQKLNSEKSSCENNLKVYESQKSALNANIEQTKKQIEFDKNEILRLNAEVENEEKIKDSINSHLAIINKMNTVIARDFRGFLLNGIIEYINIKAKEYSNDIFDTDKIDFKLDGNNIMISYDNKELSNLSGGEKQKVDIIIQFAIRDMLCKYLNFSSNILVIDEIFDALDSIGCEKVVNMISNKLNDVQSLYIISHHADELQIPCDHNISVIKGKDKVSKIECTV